MEPAALSLDAQSAQLRGTFAASLDSSWALFRRQLLEAFDTSLQHERPDEPVKDAPAPGLAASAAPCALEDLKPIRCYRSLQPQMLLPLPVRPHLEEEPDAAEPIWSARSSGSDEAEKRNSRRPSVMQKVGLHNDSLLAVTLQESLKNLDMEEDQASTPADSTPGGPQVPNAAQERLQVRLGALSPLKVISAQELHDTVSSLGLTAFSVEEIETMLNFLADFIQLEFPHAVEVPVAGKYEKSPSGFMKRITSNTKDQKPKRSSKVVTAGPPDWHWPRPQPPRRMSQMGRASISVAAEPERRFNVVPFRALVLAFHMEESEVERRIFPSPRIFQQFQAVKEILLAGDANRLVAELTFVRINDLAAPEEQIDVLLYLEPIVAFTIVANGVMIGFQSTVAYQDWDGWFWFEVGFALVLILECALRNFVSGFRNYFCGTERIWNWCDLVFIGTALTDLMLEMMDEDLSAMFFTTLLRFVRLVRLTRIVKVFRLHWMKELRLMLKGLVGSMQTLLMAFVLLFAVLYVLAGLATYTLGRDAGLEEAKLHTLFENLPVSMFTAFRCFTGQCETIEGAPLAAILSEKIGLLFVIPYICSYMLVSMGIFNVILAVYVDITMRAAKESEATTFEQHARESVRIARTTRELLKRFAAANKIFREREGNDMSVSSRPSVRSRFDLDLSPQSAAHFTDQAMQEEIEITKELFLLVVQDPGVQGLMDDLDLPADRANLFEVIDSDQSGTLHVSELVQGLLKVRGELKKSDCVAGLLATQSLQQMVADMREEMRGFLQNVLEKLPASPRSTAWERNGVGGKL